MPVFDVGATDTGIRYIVSKLVSGGNLRQLKFTEITIDRSLLIVIPIAGALAYAHEKGFVHRDVKPANILLTSDGLPILADFGLALHSTEFGTGARYVGTPSYMSPEQARMEGHRVDGRSDIYSLAVVLYELLTGTRPFKASNIPELLDCVRSVEVRPPRQINRSISRELDRICLKALAKRAVDRYSTATDFADELQLCLDEWQANHRASSLAEVGQPKATRSDSQRSQDERSGGSGKLPAVVPKGLRAFDAADADFFPSLLPGARDRHGIPECIRFWQTRIEQRVPQTTFRTGVMLGPSGSGKSSLVRAGILPVLDSSVTTLIVESRPDGFEKHLLKRIQHLFPDLDRTDSLSQTMLSIRNGQGISTDQKFLVVIDQFEQWLTATPPEQQIELLEALRQCDGVATQTLLLVRDDFTVPLIQFLDQLEEPLLQNHNFATIDRFGVDHARHVLSVFGQAYGTVQDPPTEEQKQFIAIAVKELEQDELLVPVQIAIFADIVKDRQWTPETLRAMGGARGVGVKFLDERISSPSAHPVLSANLGLIRCLLAELLPAPGAHIKGAARSLAELEGQAAALGVAGDAGRVLSVLETELRLVSSRGDKSTDSATGSALSGSAPSSVGRETSFQLTHDFMVPAIRQWLSQFEQSSQRGRARIHLREIAQAWSTKPEARQLPSLAEWASITALTKRATWNNAERTVMRKATLRIVRNAAMLAVLVTVVMGFVWRADRSRDSVAVVERLLAADTSEVPQVIADMAPLQDLIVPQLRALAATQPDATAASDSIAAAAGSTTMATDDISQRRRLLHLSLALATSDAQWLDRLLDQIPATPVKDLFAVRQTLHPFASHSADPIWTRLQDNIQSKDHAGVLACGAVLAELSPHDDRWAQCLPEISRLLVQARPTQVGYWRDLYEPQAAQLLPFLHAAFTAKNLPKDQHSTVVEFLAEYGGHDLKRLAEMMVQSSVSDLPLLTSSVSLRSADLSNQLQLQLKRHSQSGPTAMTETRTLAADLIDTIEGLGGSIDPACAWFAKIKRSDFDRIAPRLAESGFAVRSLRHHAFGDEAAVTAIWHASTLPSEVVWEMTTQQARDTIQARSAAGWDLSDFDQHPDPSHPNPWTLVFSKQPPDAVPHIAELAMSYSDFRKQQATLEADGYAIHRYQSRAAADLNLQISVVWKKVSDQRQTSERHWHDAKHFGNQHPGFSICDLRSQQIATLPDPHTVLEDLQSLNHRFPEFVAESVKDQAARTMAAAWIQKAEHELRLGNSSEALATIGTVRKAFLNSFDVHYVHGKIFFQQNLSSSTDHLAKAIKACRNAKPQDADKLRELELKLFILQDNAEECQTHLDAIRQQVQDHPENTKAREQLLRSLAAICQRPDFALAEQAMTELCLLLESALKDELFSRPDVLLLDIANEAVRQNSRFKDVLQQTGFDRSLQSAYWQSTDFESRLLNQLDQSVHRQKADELRRDGFVPVVITVSENQRQQMVVTSAWTRAVMSIDQQVQRARTISNAVLALAARGDRDRLLLAFQDQWGRDVRSNVIASLAKVVPAQTSARMLTGESFSSPDVRRHVLLAIGGYDWHAFSTEVQSTLRTQVALWMRNQQHSGLRSSAQWCAQQWNLPEEDTSAPVSTDAGSLAWTRNSIGQIMVVLPECRSFLMGSPLNELQRNADEERLHDATTGRITEISSTEISEAQFRQFMNDPDVKPYYSADESSIAVKNTPLPQVRITWNDARRFCQWLSKREGIPESQWCYPDAWANLEQQPPPPEDYLQRTGYRLPTEMEWEYAAKAGSTSTWHCGHDAETLMAFEWLRASTLQLSGNSSIQPVGSSRPNDFGLFDMLGNAGEWCDDPSRAFKSSMPGRPRIDSNGFARQTNLDKLRINVRGGAFGLSSENCRSAKRLSSPPTTSQNNLGFRIARTRTGQVRGER